MKITGILLSAWLVTPAIAHAQSHTFFVTLGNDTIAIDRFARTSNLIQGELKTRATGPRTTYVLTLANGLAARMQIAAYRSESDTAPTRTVVVTFRGDSAISEVESNGQKVLQQFKTEAGAFPYLNLSFALLEPAIAHARAAGLSAVRLFNISGGETVAATLVWVGTDSLSLKIGAADLRLHVDDAGHILGGAMASQNLRILRRTTMTGARITAADYSAPAGAGYTAENVAIKGPAGMIGGTVTFPKGRSGRVPVVVTLSGSGLQDRDEAMSILSGYRPFRQIAEALAARGIGVLRYDDRGFGESTGDVARATPADFADDARAVLAYLRTRDEADTTKLFLLGHSEGGLIAPLIASTDRRVRGIIVMAGPSRTGRRILEYQNRSSISANRRLQPAQRDSLYRDAMRHVDSSGVTLPWMRWFLSYDPLPAARVTKAAVLILHGATDRQVTADQARELGAAFRAGGNKDVTVRVLPGVNHLFLSDPSGDPAGYTKLPNRQVVADVVALITDWVVQTAK